MHIGNMCYRKLIRDCTETYDNVTYPQKKIITDEIVNIVKQSSGRFLKYSGVGWLEVGDDVARLKVSHTFRGVRRTKA